MGDPTKGLIEKFYITRVDGTSAPGEKHHGCDYFVLDLTHDPFAGIALLAYAEACEDDYPSLALDLYEKVDVIKRLSPDREKNSD